ncbi:MAG TPA: hypothetical protein VKF82_11785 [Candidatus Eremiobacteraceae bacterium]|nr:hypothetical protein [Candidatus Eremiobacteraceae bacterium]
MQVAPAQYDASFSCDCKPQALQSSGTLATRPKTGVDFDFDYPNSGTATLGLALRGGQQVVADAPGLQPGSKWRSSVSVLVEDQTFAVPVSASVTSVASGVASIEVQGELDDQPMRLQMGTIPMSITLSLVEHVKLGQSAGDSLVLISLAESMVDHFARDFNGRPWDATVKAALTAK